MKLVSLFDEFLKNTVNLNQSRLDGLTQNVAALKDFLRQHDWGVDVRGFEGQGSWAHQTIIKPVDGREFDADLLVMTDPVKGWSASDYVESLYKVFRDSDTYKDKVHRSSHCVTITYAGDRRVDIAPCVRERIWAGSYEVCNRSTDSFERSEPVGYTAWMRERNSYSGANSFRKVTRLLKYLRDIKTRFTCSSVLLTTLVGYQIEWFDKDSSSFEDTPTTLRTIVGRLDDWLQARPSKPIIENPKLLTEDLARNMTATQYDNFRAMIKKYRDWIDDAYLAKTRSDSIIKWRRLFGDDFAKDEDVSVLSKGNILEAILSKSLVLSTAAHMDSLVDDVRNFGVTVLPPSFYKPPYQKSPPWLRAAKVTDNVQVVATYHADRYAPGRAVGRGESLPRSGGLWFNALIGGRDEIPDGFRVEWRITNTGVEALARRSGRGGFYTGQRVRLRWEALQYRGVHLAEAFVIRNSDDLLVGQSPPFEVVIT